MAILRFSNRVWQPIFVECAGYSSGHSWNREPMCDCFHWNLGDQFNPSDFIDIIHVEF
jgi:hypothetical protein